MNWGQLVVYLMIGFIGSASQFREDLVVDVVVIERIKTLAVVGNTGEEGRIEAEQMIGARKDVT